MAAKLLKTENIVKEFGPVRVLDKINFDLAAGEVHALVGENGAGKSTLMKIITGYHQPTEGKIYLNDKQVNFNSVAESEANGIAMIYQELNLAQDLSVEENIFLGQEEKKKFLIDQKKMIKESQEILAELKTDIPVNKKIRDLSISNQQMVEIAKAARKKAKIIIMDEPTSSLTNEEVEVLFEKINKLKESGVGIIFISHKLDEVKEIADRVTILKDGQHVKTAAIEQLNEEEIANLMVGREITDLFPEKREEKSKNVLLEVENLSVENYVKDASFKLYENEILGFSGLVGAGRTELWEGIVGLKNKKEGRILKNNKQLKIDSYLDAVKEKIVYLSEDRKGKALLVDKDLISNLTLLSLDKFASPLIDRKKEYEAFKKAKKQFEIQVPDDNTIVDKLSGGNQQKLAVAKIMEIDPEIIIFDEPTRGIDVGTKQQIYNFIKELVTEKNKTCIFISSELQEIIGLCTRVIVMHEGRIAGSLSGDEIKEEIIMQYATGLKGAV